MLPKEAVKEDARLEKAHESTSVELMKHRWHWTLDESNPDRVSIRGYAAAVGKSQRLIQRYAKGYALLGDDARVVTPSEALERAGVSGEKEAVIEAIAGARGQAFQTVRQNRPTEIKRVRQWAQEEAEEKGTTVEEEAPKIAKWIVRGEDTERELERTRKERYSFDYFTLEGKLAKAQRILKEALRAAENAEVSEEELELLIDAIGKVRAILGLIDLRLSGEANVDWDVELAKLSKEA